MSCLPRPHRLLVLASSAPQSISAWQPSSSARRRRPRHLGCGQEGRGTTETGGEEHMHVLRVLQESPARLQYTV